MMVAQFAATLYVGLVLTLVALVVLRDSRRHVPYRDDMLALQAGVFASSGRNSVLRARSNRNHKKGCEQGKDLSHDLMVRLGADR